MTTPTPDVPTDTHHIGYGTDPLDTLAWLSDHGYRGVIVVGPVPGPSGLLYDRGPGTPVQLAMLGDTIVARSADR